jgi:hypothetical protein
VGEKTILSRRKTLACLCTAPILAIWPQAKIQANKKHPSSIYDQVFLARLMEVLDIQAEMNHSSSITTQGREATSEAFERLAPRTHLEASIIAVFAEKARHAGVDWKSQKPDIIGEYVRRRSSAKAQLPDHPLLSCPGLGMPHTYRLLFFREQVTGVVQILTGATQKRAENIRWQLISDMTLRKNLFDGIFFEEITENYGMITLGELEAIFWNIEAYRTLFGPSYVWASTMVSRAERGTDIFTGV